MSAVNNWAKLTFHFLFEQHARKTLAVALIILCLSAYGVSTNDCWGKWSKWQFSCSIASGIIGVILGLFLLIHYMCRYSCSLPHSAAENYATPRESITVSVTIDSGVATAATQLQPSSASQSQHEYLPDVGKLLNILDRAPPALAILADHEAMIVGLIAFQERAFNENKQNARGIVMDTYLDMVRSLMCGDREWAKAAMTAGEALGIDAEAYHAGVLAATAAAERRVGFIGVVKQ